MLRSCAAGPVIIIFVKLGFALSASVERNRPRAASTLLTVPPMPPIPDVEEAKMIFGSVG